MAIGCVYCGGEHATAGEVRQCWQRAEASNAPLPAVSSDESLFDDRSHVDASVSAPARPAPEPATLTPWIQPGPDQLARGIVILAGGNVPSPWRDAERVVVDHATLVDPASLVATLAAHADARRRVVIELAVPFYDPPRSTEADPPFTLGARFWFPLDVLFHQVWNNSIDATGAEPHWWAVDRAVAMGATLADDDGCDLVLPGGQRVWLDGGPIGRHRPIDQVAVLHTVAIEHGSLTPPADRETSAELADDQRAAVGHLGAAARIIAPAGSGKTRVLTERARHLLRDWQIPAGAVHLVAFNKRAQEEMQARTPDLGNLRVRTLNAIALAIVNGSAPFKRQQRTMQTIDEITVRRIIGRLVQFPRKRNTDPMASWIEALSVIRLGLRDPHDVESMYNGDVDGLADMWPRYRAALAHDGALDFDEQIYRAIELLLTDAETREVAQRACRLLLVDEFQDLTPEIGRAHV